MLSVWGQKNHKYQQMGDESTVVNKNVSGIHKSVEVNIVARNFFFKHIFY
jgi:hypothetical protein